MDRDAVVHRHQRLRPQCQWRQGEERRLRIHRDAKARTRLRLLAERRLYQCAAQGRYRPQCRRPVGGRSEEHTSELQSLMRISYAVLCLKTNKTKTTQQTSYEYISRIKQN